MQFDEYYKPFQQLIFLVRDWEYPGEANYGEGGGKIILDQRLQYDRSMPPEKKLVRQHIRTCFTDVRCFLMPHPGPAITDPRFNGRLKDLSSDFKLHLSVLVPWILAPENLVIKRISGTKVKAKDLTNFFWSYSRVLSGRELPAPKTLYMATADGNNAMAVAEAKELYNKIMVEDIMGGQKKYVEPLILRVEHKRIKETVMKHFDDTKKIGGEEYSREYRRRLDEDLEKMFRQFYKDNHSRKHWYWRRPALYARAALTFIALGQIMRRMGANNLTILCVAVYKIAFVSMLCWFYARHRRLDGQSWNS
uniref:Atlastin n=1 Tax=Lygus hesperus TaxID=30085 RepID=A0A0A9X7F8_LYGHE